MLTHKLEDERRRAQQLRLDLDTEQLASERAAVRLILLFILIIV